jgi:predicted ATPase
MAAAVVVASRDTREAPLRPEATIQLTPLAEDMAEGLLHRLIRGAALPETLRRDMLRQAAGAPGRLEELVQMLIDTQVLTRTEDEAGWSCNPQATFAVLSTMNYTTVINQMEQSERDLLSQCAVQGVDFDPEVTEAVQRLLNRQGPPVSILLTKLERQGRVTRVKDHSRPQWSFSQPLLQQACYEALAFPLRLLLHSKTAEALSELGGKHGVIPAELLTYHYERAEQWLPAAKTNLRAGDCAADLFLNAEAVQRYQHAVEAIDLLQTPSSEAVRIATLAHAGVTRVHLRVGEFGLAAEAVAKMQRLAVRPDDGAEADRLAALVHFHMGRINEAERLLYSAIASARQDKAAESVLAHALGDLTKLLCNTGRLDAALKQVQECRAVATCAGDAVTLTWADVLESDIAAAEGRSADAATGCARAYEAALRIGSLSELARASNGLGIAARDVGDYEAAQRHFEQALEIWELSGDAEWRAGGYSNLGMLALSRGDLAAAKGYYERALTVFRAIGSIDRLALVKANLATQALEEGNFLSAVTIRDGADRIEQYRRQCAVAWIGVGRAR